VYRCQDDLNSFSPGKLKETTGTSSYNVVEDYSAGPKKSVNLSMNEAISMAQNRPLYRD